MMARGVVCILVALVCVLAAPDAWADEAVDLSGSPFGSMALVVGTALVALGVGIGLLIASTSLEERERKAEIETAEAQRRIADREQGELRFLTMLSHDLRTPLNGVLGLMALVRQSGLSHRQAKLLGNAERVGNHLNGLLRDLLDFAELRNGSANLTYGPVPTADLTASVERCFDERADQLRLSYTVSWTREPPDQVVGDQARLHQVVTYLCVYLSEVVRAKHLDVTLTHVDQAVVMSVVIPAGSVGKPGWRAEELLERSGVAEGPFGSDAAGPMIVRGLTRLMSGRLTVENDATGATELRLELPAPASEAERSVVRFELASDTTALLLHSLLDETAWEPWTPAVKPDVVAAVVMEGGSTSTAVNVASLRALHPKARFISLGGSDRRIRCSMCMPGVPGGLCLGGGAFGQTQRQRAAR